MQKKLYANLLHGMDSFMRVAMTLRRRELKLKSISMTNDCKDVELVLNEDDTPLDAVLSHMNKLCDVENLRVVNL
ncbi:MAG: ACT domain-containing protein [Peptoniphilaceae bacterium]|nr:ACT domain-containing protein [Peptoniphilaceae bacterium]MDD7383747.1 ACT domain-containing protein [Peptoniphilaceae bacterium]MDY3737853.1 ACT domain-containing protein [Peptoniphilaceae bacterium]